VRDVAAAGHKVIAIPGASALLAGLVVSGLPTDQFLFCGFPPPKAQARQRWLARFAEMDATLVFYESAKRTPDTLRAMADIFGPREASMARELTKKFETVWRDSLDALAERAEHEDIRGEVVLLVGPPAEEIREWDEARVVSALETALAKEPPSRAARSVAALSGWDRQHVYQLAIAKNHARK
jgi:16S rRNA (cytidine1402-2'-O)-methyltransferase